MEKKNSQTNQNYITKRPLLAKCLQGSCELTLGPGGPTRPAAPGKPVAPLKRKNKLE